MSGGFSTSQDIDGEIFRGDVFTEDKAWNDKFDAVIECKSTKDQIGLDQYALLLAKEKCKLKRWVDQCMRESGDKNWWLIFRWNYMNHDLVICGTKDGYGYISSPMLLDRFLSTKVRLYTDYKTFNNLKDGDKE